MANPATLPPLMEGYGRKRKKRTSIETNIKLTLEKRFLDVSNLIDSTKMQNANLYLSWYGKDFYK